MSLINKIKEYKLKIFDAEDDLYPNRKKAVSTDKAIWNYLDKQDYTDKEKK